jgi:hypothetical protein
MYVKTQVQQVELNYHLLPQRHPHLLRPQIISLINEKKVLMVLANEKRAQVVTASEMIVSVVEVDGMIV